MMTRLRLVIFALGLVLLPGTARAQVSIPFTNFVSGQVIASGESNANFAVLADQVLNRDGGTITGHIIVNPNITIDGVDLSDFFGAGGEIFAGTKGTAGAPALAPAADTDTGIYFPAADQIALVLGGTARLALDSNGLTVFGANIVNSSGKIPAISSTYFGSLDAGGIQFSEDSIADGSVLARLASSDTIAADWTFTNRLQITPTWNNSGQTFRGLELDVADDGSKSDSMLIDLRVGDTSVASVTPAGHFSVPALRLSSNPVAGAVLVSDASGVGSWVDLSNAIPTGMLAFFEGSCPEGWTRRDIYDDKFMRGGATFTGSGGGSDAAHTHSIDPPATLAASGGSHAHTVDFASATSTSAGSHGHALGGSLETGEAGSHTHSASFSTTTSSGGGSMAVEFDVGGGAATSHTHNISAETSTSSAGAHTHLASFPLMDPAGSHTHTVDLSPSSTSSDGAHQHSVDIASFTSGSTAALPAYITAVVCKKD